MPGLCVKVGILCIADYCRLRTIVCTYQPKSFSGMIKISFVLSEFGVCQSYGLSWPSWSSQAGC